ncbi:conserved protein of unknown function [Bradyrhizobium vignae]|uniref:Uncharacterized protein n=1 Tax=Bradyrhizobium vignae TaxID=1549949 RepID=A0A2U3QCI2_9BRAD|nr:conserved protein of unknown function [Bradyrhizobium vignae]
MLDPVAVLDGLRLLEFLNELLFPRQQVLYDRAHNSPIARGDVTNAEIEGARDPGSFRTLKQNVRRRGWFLGPASVRSVAAGTPRLTVAPGDTSIG